jgi:aspartate ammonia-lyase
LPRRLPQACDLIIAGDYHGEFVVDVIQGGAGTSTNMNANEVIANLALEQLGYEKGRYDILHPAQPRQHVAIDQRCLSHRPAPDVEPEDGWFGAGDGRAAPGVRRQASSLPT